MIPKLCFCAGDEEGEAKNPKSHLCTGDREVSISKSCFCTGGEEREARNLKLHFCTGNREVSISKSCFCTINGGGGGMQGFQSSASAMAVGRESPRIQSCTYPLAMGRAFPKC